MSRSPEAGACPALCRNGDFMLMRFLLTALLASGLALAQRGGGGLSRDEGGIANAIGNGGGKAQVRPMTREDTLFDKLKLDKEQREEAAKILSTAREKAAPTRDPLRSVVERPRYVLCPGRTRSSTSSNSTRNKGKRRPRFSRRRGKRRRRRAICSPKAASRSPTPSPARPATANSRRSWTSTLRSTRR